jgi:hypothetical protein
MAAGQRRAFSYGEMCTASVGSALVFPALISMPGLAIPWATGMGGVSAVSEALAGNYATAAFDATLSALPWAFPRVRGAVFGRRAPVETGPIVGGGAKLENLNPTVQARIQGFVDSHGQNVTVVGSRAGGTAGPFSDYDYLIGGNSKLRAIARWQLPRGPAGGAVGPRGETGIDIFNQNNMPLDPTKPHIIFRPRPGGG